MKPTAACCTVLPSSQQARATPETALERAGAGRGGSRATRRAGARLRPRKRDLARCSDAGAENPSGHLSGRVSVAAAAFLAADRRSVSYTPLQPLARTRDPHPLPRARRAGPARTRPETALERAGAGCSPAEPASALPASFSLSGPIQRDKRFASNGDLSLICLSQAWGPLHTVPGSFPCYCTAPLR